jgi:hypothetical protein
MGRIDFIEYTAENVIQPGRAIVKKVGTDLTCMLPTAAAQLFLGVSMASDADYQAGELVPVVKRGRVWGLAREAITPDDPVHISFKVDEFGQFAASRVVGETYPVLGAAYITSAAAGEKVLLDLDLPAFPGEAMTLTSPDGTKWRLKVDDNGILETQEVL